MVELDATWQGHEVALLVGLFNIPYVCLGLRRCPLATSMLPLSTVR